MTDEIFEYNVMPLLHDFMARLDEVKDVIREIKKKKGRLLVLFHTIMIFLINEPKVPIPYYLSSPRNKANLFKMHFHHV